MPTTSVTAALVKAVSLLENYGDHHEWCKRTPCDCRFEAELAEIRRTRDAVEQRTLTRIWHLVMGR